MDGDANNGVIKFDVERGKFYIEYEDGARKAIELRAQMLGGISIGSISAHETETAIEINGPGDVKL